eukprot:766147-Hanusia_phi.AAC.2
MSRRDSHRAQTHQVCSAAMNSEPAEIVLRQEEEIARLKSELKKSIQERQNMATYLYVRVVAGNHSKRVCAVDKNSNKHLEQARKS